MATSKVAFILWQWGGQGGRREAVVLDEFIDQKALELRLGGLLWLPLPIGKRRVSERNIHLFAQDYLFYHVMTGTCVYVSLCV